MIPPVPRESNSMWHDVSVLFEGELQGLVCCRVDFRVSSTRATEGDCEKRPHDREYLGARPNSVFDFNTGRDFLKCLKGSSLYVIPE